MKIFYAITSPPFSAALNSARQHPISPNLSSVPALALILNPKVKSCSIQHRRLTPSDSLEERRQKNCIKVLDMCYQNDKIMKVIKPDPL